MPVIKNTPRYLDLDKDLRIVDPMSMTNALNVRGVYNEGSDYFILKNTKGTIEIPFTLPNGINTVVGTIKDDDTNTLFYFLHNTLGNHSVLRYNANQKNITKILQNSKLNFRKEHIVQGFAIAGVNFGDILVYFTDGYNPPRKINTSKAIAQTNGDIQNGYGPNFDADFDLYLDQVKHPPVFSPDFEFTRVDGIQYNNIGKSSFQFRYRYRYDDGEISAFSPYSKLAVQYAQVNNAFFTDNLQNTFDNAINVTVENGGFNVEKIEIAFREGNSGELLLWETIPNNPSQSTSTVTFLNDGNYGVVPDRDNNKLFDAVPVLAKTQAIKNNRNFWGNIYDTYPQLTEQEKAGGLTLIPRYLDRFDVDSGTILFQGTQQSVLSLLLSGTVWGQNTGSIAGIPLIQGTVWAADIDVNYEFNPLLSSPQEQNYRTFFYYEIQQGDTYQDLRDALYNHIWSTQQSWPDRMTNVEVTLTSANFITLRFYFSRPAVQETHSIAINIRSEYHEEGSASPSFKSGAYHPIGVVYYDRANRSSTVNKADTVYVKFFSEREDNRNIGLERQGATYIDWRINWTPPVWATHYQWVYAKNSTIDFFLQYTNLKVYSHSNQLYIGLSSLLGPVEPFNTSYQEQYGSKLTYSFVEGDRLRVIKKAVSTFYTNSAKEGFVDGNYDFRIIDFKYLDRDETTNPIYDDSTENAKAFTSGWFLIIENPGVSGFSSPFDWESYTYPDGGTRQGSVLWEIYRRKANPEQYLYYEIGEEYEILNVGEPSRKHQGAIRDQGEQISQAITHVDIANHHVSTETEPLVVAGDIIMFTGTSGFPVGTYTVNRIVQTDTDWEIYTNEELVISGFPVNVTMFLAETAACGILKEGDVWFKQRRVKTTLIDGLIFGTEVVEDYSFSDFYSSNSVNIGRANAYSPNEVFGEKPSTIVYSDPIQLGTVYNGLSSVYLSEAPFIDLERYNNSIQKIYGLNESLIVYQENKVINLPISRNIIETADGGGILVNTTNVIGPVRYYSGDYGIGRNPESFAESDNKHYFTDIKAGSALRLSTDGITEISQYGMDSFFGEKARQYSEDLGGVKIFGAYDVEHEEYVISANDENLSTLSVNGAVSPFRVQGASIVGGVVVIGDVQIVGTNSFDRIAIPEEPRSLSESDDVISLSGYPVARMSTLSETRQILVPMSVAESGDTFTGLLVFETEDDDIIVPMELDVPNSQLTLDDSVSIEETEAIGGFTLSYSEPANKWVSFWSYRPDYMADVSNEFVSFTNGRLHVHNRNELRSNFYGVQYGSVIETVFNKEPSVVKVYHASSIESNKAWNGTFTTNINSSSVDNLSYSEREGAYFTNTPTAIGTSTTSNLHGIGEVSGINGNTIVIGGFNINDSLVSIGDTVYEGTTLVGLISSVPTVSSLTLSSVTGLSVGDYIYVSKNDSVDGDYLRGSYMKHRLDLVTEDEVEVHAVNVFVKESKLHHP